jgi:hypothetical protein
LCGAVGNFLLSNRAPLLIGNHQWWALTIVTVVKL